ncbi:MAG: transporter [Verrucomicrobiaceae bacterium]|nr:transporter [Verrucomicrobiaceae bacterium]
MLEVHHVTKHYASRPILRDVSLALAKGERVALLGPSGCGKTTLLNCIGGIDRVDSGRIELAGADLATLTSDGLSLVRRRQIGTIFQFFHLLPTLTAEENIEMPLQLTGMAKAERLERVRALMQRVGIAHRSGALPAQLSGGEMQRVAIARAVIHRPMLILADEPTGNLDSATGAQILDLLREVTEEEGTALLMVTHSDEAARACHRVLRMLDGVLL